MLMAILSASSSPMYPKESYKDMLSMAPKADKKSLMPGMADILEVVQGAGRGAKRRSSDEEDEGARRLLHTGGAGEDLGHD